MKTIAATAAACINKPRQHLDGLDVVGEADDGDEQRRARKPGPGSWIAGIRIAAMMVPATRIVAATTAIPAP